MLNLVIATTNAGKIRELDKLLKNYPFNLFSLKDFDEIPEPLEDGNTFRKNAELKATYYSLKTNSLALADDSGLEVEILNNEPGVFSARYAGEKASYEENLCKLLKKLEQSNENVRKARFICEIAVADEFGKIIFNARGVCNGTISHKPLGLRGFGYDPIFIPDGYSTTFGELSNEIKEQISHRAIATKLIINKFSDFFAS